MFSNKILCKGTTFFFLFTTNYTYFTNNGFVYFAQYVVILLYPTSIPAGHSLRYKTVFRPSLLYI